VLGSAAELNFLPPEGYLEWALNEKEDAIEQVGGCTRARV
jgi:hypothetical protein